MPQQKKNSSGGPGKTSSPPLSKRKERFFRLGLLLAPLFLLGLLEGGLRLTGYGDSIPLFQPFPADERYLRVNPRLGERYFPNTGVRPAVAETDIFLREKPRDGYRIFVLGGSSAAGYPYMYNGSFSAILKVILQHSYPNTHIEIVNLAMPAVASYAVRDIALEVTSYQPDLLLIYAGHNEFYGGLGVASSETLGHSRRLINLYLQLRSYRLVQLVSDGILLIRRALSSDRTSQETFPTTLMERMAGQRHIPYGSTLFRRAGEIFAENLNDVLQHAAAQDIPVLIGTVVSNIRHQEPFVDVFQDPGREGEWQALFRQAEAHYRQQEYRRALEVLERCAVLDSLPASQYFLQGQVYLALGDTLRAYPAFYRAKEFDGLRFRAAEDINRRITALGKHRNTAVVEIRRAFEAASPGRLPGNNLLLEHLHPNLAGYQLMAREYARRIVAQGGLGPPAAILPDTLGTDQPGVTEVDLLTARLRIAYLQEGWPFSSTPLPSRQQFALPDKTVFHKLARQFWNGEITWEKMHVQAARYYEKEEDWERAAREYRALVLATPANGSAYLFLARTLMKQEKYSQALTVLQQAAVYEQSARLYSMIGDLYRRLDQPRRAIVYFEKVIERNSRDYPILLKLARSYAEVGDYHRANILVQQILRAGIDSPEARALVRFLRPHL